MSEPDTFPEFRDWSIAAVRLLQGVVYLDDKVSWITILSHRSALENYFARLALRLVIDETDGFAFLRQISEDELPEGYDRIPKLFRRTRLSYDATLLCILLREEQRRFDEEEVHDERCVIEASELLEHWKAFQPPELDDVRLKKGMNAALKTLENMKFVRPFSTEPEVWEIRPIIKARLTVVELETLRNQLLEAVGRRPKKDDAN